MVRLNRQPKECKRVLVIDATDYPMVRVMKPLPADPGMFKWAMWTFTEINRKEVTNDLRKSVKEMEEGSSYRRGYRIR